MTFILVAIWVLQYLGGVALRPKEVRMPCCTPPYLRMPGQHGPKPFLPVVHTGHPEGK